MTSSTILTVTCLAVTACVAIFMIISVSLPQWYTVKVVDHGVIYKAELGLFKECMGAAGRRVCLTLEREYLPGV